MNKGLQKTTMQFKFFDIVVNRLTIKKNGSQYGFLRSVLYCAKIMDSGN